MLLPLATSGCTTTPEKFYSCIFLYHNRPQLINRKLIGSVHLYFYRLFFSSNIIQIRDLMTKTSILYELRKLPELNRQTLSNLIKDILQPYNKTLTLKESNIEEFKDIPNGYFVSVQLLLPKGANKEVVEVVIFDKNDNIITFLAVEKDNSKHKQKEESIDIDNISDEKIKTTINKNVAPNFPYHLEYLNTGHIRLTVDTFDDADSPSGEWLADKLFPKLIKWAEEYEFTSIKPSLSLIPIEKYSYLYNNLKKKYAMDFVKSWKENTDPLKFVYEDIAIATYLICLWDHLGQKKPSFVDLGCGNGLLVYILNKEGYSGYGVDVRSRKIWESYPESIRLVVKTLRPSDENLFPETDWIIGNHSDELTPWIPIISLRSSDKTNFFILPCCSYDFNGQKYHRINTSKSQYAEYLDYIEDVCEKCGFKTERDKLRIPSTKKTCIISFGRVYKQDSFIKVNETIQNFIDERCGIREKESGIWVSSFQARPTVEKVRNCTQLERGFVSRVIKEVVKILLKEKVLVEVPGSSWNCGGCLSFKEIVKEISRNDLKVLKSECGGLQTLLKNHIYIFVVEKGQVKLRVPCKFKVVSKFKHKPCWFYFNHPDGCLNNSKDCAYNHCDENIRRIENENISKIVVDKNNKDDDREVNEIKEENKDHNVDTESRNKIIGSKSDEALNKKNKNVKTNKALEKTTKNEGKSFVDLPEGKKK